MGAETAIVMKAMRESGLYDARTLESARRGELNGDVAALADWNRVFTVSNGPDMAAAEKEVLRLCGDRLNEGPVREKVVASVARYFRKELGKVRGIPPGADARPLLDFMAGRRVVVGDIIAAAKALLAENEALRAENAATLTTPGGGRTGTC